METHKMYERINWYEKQEVYYTYTRIVTELKDYNNISRKKIIEEIYEVYSDYNNIINICTTRELKYLQMILNKKCDSNELLKDKYEWERKTLKNKFLLQIDFEDNVVFIPDEIIHNVKKAIKKVNWHQAQKLDELNEVLVGYCKIRAISRLIDVAISISFSMKLKMKDVLNHMTSNRVFMFYVFIYAKEKQDFNVDNLNFDNLYVVYHEYHTFKEDIEKAKAKQGIEGIRAVEQKTYQNIFYNDFDIDDPDIKKFLDELKQLPIAWDFILYLVHKFSVLNLDRTPLKKLIAGMPALKDYDLTEFFKLLDVAMDEMPSAVLNGFTPRQARTINLRSKNLDIINPKRYVRQENAHLSKEDAQLFYKIYFSLLEFTNNKYLLYPNLKISKSKCIDIPSLNDISEKFWENKVSLIQEFCLTNPYKFKEKELQITKEFSKGYRDTFMIAKFEREYTALVCQDKTYMIKGINRNIDEVVPYRELPKQVRTTIIPFKNVLVYDSLFYETDMNVEVKTLKEVEKAYSQNIKYYHL